MTRFLLRLVVFAVPLAAWRQRRGLARSEALGVVAAVLGLTTFLALTRPTGEGHTLDAMKVGVAAEPSIAGELLVRRQLPPRPHAFRAGARSSTKRQDAKAERHSVKQPISATGSTS